MLRRRFLARSKPQETKARPDKLAFTEEGGRSGARDAGVPVRDRRWTDVEQSAAAKLTVDMFGLRAVHAH